MFFIKKSSSWSSNIPEAESRIWKECFRCNIVPCKKYRHLTNFLAWKFCGKAQFPHTFRRIARNYAETVPFHKISTARNQVKLQYFWQWLANEETQHIIVGFLMLLYTLSPVLRYITPKKKVISLMMIIVIINFRYTAIHFCCLTRIVHDL